MTSKVDTDILARICLGLPLSVLKSHLIDNPEPEVLALEVIVYVDRETLVSHDPTEEATNVRSSAAGPQLTRALQTEIKIVYIVTNNIASVLIVIITSYYS
jgi:hypothetical protein